MVNNIVDQLAADHVPFSGIVSDVLDHMTIYYQLLKSGPNCAIPGIYTA